MRVTFVLPPVDLTGGVRVVAIYARRLKARGHRVTVVSTPARAPSLARRLRSLLRGRGWSRLARPMSSHFDGVDVDHRVIDRSRPVTDADVPEADVVLATWWETAEWVARLSPSRGAKAYLLQHHEVHAGQPADRVAATWSLPMHKIVVSRWLQDLARTRYGDPRASLVPNSVDTEQFNAPPRGRRDPPTVGLVYSSMPFKGCDVSLRALALASRALAGLRLVAFSPWLPSPELPLPPAAEYTTEPPQDELRHIYASCNAWLVGSRSEGFGLPILEAMACRTPVIATSTGAAPELLAGGGGLLVEPEDPEGMARAIERVHELSDVDWRAMSDAAHATATAYTWDQATDGLEAALRLAVDRRARGETA